MVGVGVRVIVGVLVGVGVSVGGAGVSVAVADRYALVCMADHVIAAMVSGGTSNIAVVAVPQASAINIAIRNRATRPCRRLSIRNLL